jgi:hypothetical protein
MAKKKKGTPKRGQQGAGGVKRSASVAPEETREANEVEPAASEPAASEPVASEPPPSAKSDAGEDAETGSSDVPPSFPASMPRPEPEREQAEWGKPLVRLERAWTRFEAWLLFVVLVFLLASLVFWVALSGMASPIATGNAAGTVFRGIVGVTCLGLAARLLTRNRGLSEQKRSLITLGAAVVGGLLAPSWRSVGVE